VIYLTFLFSALVVVVAATKLAQYGDAIAVRARLGGMFIGTLLLAGATSLPELLSGINALSLGVPDMAAGSMFGSGMFNMFMLALLDLLFYKARLLRQIATTHALTASLANLLTGLAVLFVLADIDLRLGWIGVDSLLIISAYFVGVRLLQRGSGLSRPPVETAIPPDVPALQRALLGFGLASLVLVVITPILVRSANQIAETSGISAGFIGATLVAVTTSLPELVATIAAARLGAFDLAVGNLFGSNIFNMFALGLTDFFYIPGRLLGAIDPSFAIAGLLVVTLTSLGLIGNLARVERRFFFVEMDALLILVGYFLGMYLLFIRGIGG
jgi:cation:H+ antiporter